MSQKEIAGVTIEVDDSGYMTKFEDWSKEVAAGLAKENGIDVLTPKHWEVIEYIQKEFQNESTLSIRKVGKSGVVDIKEFYNLFPDGPLKKATLISGVPKPSGCV